MQKSAVIFNAAKSAYGISAGIIFVALAAWLLYWLIVAIPVVWSFAMSIVSLFIW